MLHRVINRLERHYEKRWVGTASLITASSAQIAAEVSALVNVEGHALFNGFVSEDFDEYQNYLAGNVRVNDVKSEAALQFSRKRQAGRLAGLLDSAVSCVARLSS